MTTMTPRAAAGSGPTTAMRRMRALARAEVTLLLRNRTALFTTLALPLFITLAMKQTAGDLDLSGTGLSVATVLLPASFGYVLLFAVYTTLVSTYVARREELVFKRLRTGETTDAEILAGAALPTVILAVVQCALLLAGGLAVLDAPAPARPELVALGLVLGLLMTVALAAVSTLITRTTEAAQLTVMPLMLVSLACSGLVVPLEVFPDRLADVFARLPFSPVMELIRGGWTGGPGAMETLAASATALAWTVLAAYAVRRWFHWEPRR